MAGSAIAEALLPRTPAVQMAFNGSRGVVVAPYEPGNHFAISPRNVHYHKTRGGKVAVPRSPTVFVPDDPPRATGEVVRLREQIVRKMTCKPPRQEAGRRTDRSPPPPQLRKGSERSPEQERLAPRPPHIAAGVRDKGAAAEEDQTHNKRDRKHRKHRDSKASPAVSAMLTMPAGERADLRHDYVRAPFGGLIRACATPNSLRPHASAPHPTGAAPKSSRGFSGVVTGQSEEGDETTGGWWPGWSNGDERTFRAETRATFRRPRLEAYAGRCNTFTAFSHRKYASNVEFG